MLGFLTLHDCFRGLSVVMLKTTAPLTASKDTLQPSACPRPRVKVAQAGICTAGVKHRQAPLVAAVGAGWAASTLLQGKACWTWLRAGGGRTLRLVALQELPVPVPPSDRFGRGPGVPITNRRRSSLCQKAKAWMNFDGSAPRRSLGGTGVWENWSSAVRGR